MLLDRLRECPVVSSQGNQPPFGSCCNMVSQHNQPQHFSIGLWLLVVVGRGILLVGSASKLLPTIFGPGSIEETGSTKVQVKSIKKQLDKMIKVSHCRENSN